MEARQRVKLSLTNRSIGLFYPASASRAAASPQEDNNDTKTAHKHPSDASHPILEYPQKTHTASADGPSGGWSTWWS